MGTTWIDLTTSRALRDRGPVGITRVERTLGLDAARHYGEGARFMHFDRYSDSWTVMAPDRAMGLLAGGARWARSGHGAQAKRPGIGHRIERALRPGLRRIARKLSLVGGASREPQFTAADTVVLLGDMAAMRGEQQLIAAKRKTGFRLIAMCYDLIPWRFPHYFADPAAVERFCGSLEALLRNADLMLCPSRATEHDLRAFAQSIGAPPPRIAQITLGSDPPPPGSEQAPAWAGALSPDGFVLCVGTIQVRKNHRLLYQVWRRMAEDGVAPIPTLVLAGDRGWLTGDVLTLIERDPLTRDHIRIAGAVGDDELAWLYRNCLFSVYPSLYEGWGLPVAESLAAGRPCIASSAASMPEAGAGLAVLIDPLDLRAWYDAVLAFTTDRARLAACAERIRQGARPPTWAEATQRFRALLDG
jgi:glycosyltransferase involved in cell wall biosynthesis